MNHHATDPALFAHSDRLVPTVTAITAEDDARALEYVMASGCCPTCLVEGADPTLRADELEALPACPTCGTRSVEWEQAAQIDTYVTSLVGLRALEEAVFGERGA